MRARLVRQGAFTPQQVAGRRWPIGCVSLEITQRCNLDCSVCYLSDRAEAHVDLPLGELLRRIDLIAAHYGPGTDVQVSGGEPTLRSRDDLLAIVRHLARRGLRGSLFTNGIRATRELLAALARAGLVDVAFHVDTTQRRAGYTDEASLNALRRSYIERARGLPLAVFFNTTVHAGNLHELPLLARFFAEQSDVVGLASFQLQADTGRGVLRSRAPAVTQQGVMAALSQGAGCTLDFESLLGGHPQCNRYALAWVIGGALHPLARDPRDAAFVARTMRETSGVELPRGKPMTSAIAMARALALRPALWPGAVGYALRLAWRARRGLWAARGRIGKLSFFIHNFMDSAALDAGRIDACVFAVMTRDGPMSMCAYNAERATRLVQSIRSPDGGAWSPLRPDATSKVLPIKFLKGREREAALATRRVAVHDQP